MLLSRLSRFQGPEASSLETFRLRISSSLAAPLINFLLVSSTTRTFHWLLLVPAAEEEGEAVAHFIATGMADCVQDDYE